MAGSHHLFRSMTSCPLYTRSTPPPAAIVRIAGDKLYGVDAAISLRFCNNTLTEADRRALRIGCQALHAGYRRFPHPAGHGSLEFAAPLPPDLAAALQGRTVTAFMS